MAPALRVTVSLLAALAASAQERVTPVQKVITLLSDLKTQVEQEGAAEAATYDSFACFCKSTTESKSTAITEGRDDIDSFSADISAKTADKVEKTTELQERKTKQEQLAKELDETTVRCAKEKAEYEATAADLSKAISSLNNAIASMESSKPVLMSVRKSIQKSLDVADAMNLLPANKRQAVSNFLQAKVDPSDPTYKYHSSGIIDTLKKLLTEFTAEKTTLETEWGKTNKVCTDTKAELGNSMTTNKNSMDQLDTSIATLQGEIATARESLVNAESALKDDQQYLKDLTKRCESRAKDWDQRSQMRADEIKALAGALDILENKVSSLDSVNQRALIQKAVPAVVGKAVEAVRKAPIAQHVQKVALIQDSEKRGLRGAAANTASSRQARAVELLKSEGDRLHSEVLTALSAKVAADPFGKVKTLIQQLIERLLKEATAEATKKGFCDEALGKAKKDRDYRYNDAMALNTELKGLELKKVELEEEIKLLGDSIDSLNADLKEADRLRGLEHDDNIKTLSDAKEGLAAVSQALTILKVFYKDAAKAKSLIQASPVDEDTTGAGFSGNYAGKQGAAGGVIGMIEVIKSDFERTIRTTEAAEKKAAAEFVEFDRVSKTDISGKSTKKELDEEDLKTTENKITSKMADLQTNMNLVDSALKTLEDLKPTCIDTGMSYAERVEKREEEMAALKNALCILDTNGVEAECV